MTALETTLADLSRQYAEVHTHKEDLFWCTKMGLAEDMAAARQSYTGAEQAWHAFLQDPARLAGLRRLEPEAGAAPDSQRRALGGWIAMFSAHVIESPDGRRLSAELVELEGELDRQRRAMPLGYVDPATGRLERASSVQLALMLRSDPNEARRKAAFEGLASIEGYVLSHGFLDIVKKRNQLARSLGYEDYYAWRVAVVERMTKQRLFGLLDELAQSTRAPMLRELERFAARHGEHAREPWNFSYLRLGKSTQALDPYLRFAPALERWMASFHALGVRLRGATLTLDLVDRPGKYENGFMHGPGIAFFDRGTWQPARINFSANAVVGQVGAGMQATRTLFHEGGHAAHFSNILSDAPCFAQEFAPTSVAYAETQSMFLDSLLEDGEWLQRYATDASGAPPSLELLEARIREEQPFRGWDVRAMLTVPFAERALYELADDDLSPDRVLESFRKIERDLQGLTRAARPVLAVPHLLSGESSAYYHGYVLAEMAVHQTRQHFLARDGFITDNPRVGPELAASYWAPGNAATFDQTLQSLTGTPLSARALLERCNASTDAVLASTRERIERLADVPRRTDPVDLNGSIVVIHGREHVTSTCEHGYAGAARAFSDWIERLERDTAQARASQ